MAFDVDKNMRAWQGILGTRDVIPSAVIVLIVGMRELVTKMLRVDNDRREDGGLECDPLCSDIVELARRVAIYEARTVAQLEVNAFDREAIDATVTAPLMRGDFSLAEMPDNAIAPGEDISRQQPSDLGRIFVLANQVELRDEAEEFHWEELAQDFADSADELLDRAKDKIKDAVPGGAFGAGAALGILGGAAGIYLLRRLVR